MASAIDSNSVTAIHGNSYIILVSLSCIIDDLWATILFCWIAGQLQTLGKRGVKALRQSLDISSDKLKQVVVGYKGDWCKVELVRSDNNLWPRRRWNSGEKKPQDEHVLL